MRKFYLLLLWAAEMFSAAAQETFPVNGVADERADNFAFINATIIKDPQTTITNATLVISRGKIVSVGSNTTIPKDAVVIDCKGKYIYPSFIDIFSDYGIAHPAASAAKREWWSYQNISNTKGAYGWNEALKPETNASELFSANEAKAKDLRTIGFGTVLTHQQDGIASGTGALVTLGKDKENLLMIKDKAAAFYSFNKGTSTQDYPTSLMGTIALLRQTYLDGKWYKNRPATEGTNLSLEAWNNNQNLPQIFEANDKWNDLRASKIGNEFGVKYIIKGGGNEYQRMEEMKASGASFVIPLNFPFPMDVEDANDARVVALSVMKHWEMAPLQPGMFEKAGINFALTASGLKDNDDFLSNLHKAIDNGLTAAKALEALTKTPAALINVYDKVGSLDAGKLANFIITSGPLFNEKTIYLQNWIRGKRYIINDNAWSDVRGSYKLTVKQNNSGKEYNIEVAGTPDKPSATVQSPGDTTKTNVSLSVDDKLVKLTWSLKSDSSNVTSLTGIITGKVWTGTGFNSVSNIQNWNMIYVSPYIEKPDTSKDEKKDLIADSVAFPFDGYGWTKAPKQENLLIKNATVWTNEKEGKLENSDVLIKNGKIAAIGKNLNGGNAKVIDGTGKHPGNYRRTFSHCCQRRCQ